ncbi:MAG: energy-coupling factor ABC transporter permease, partial [Clostridiales bacterium]|nr:energy-coupling factor ABC transporter permease [Clostridiales bacterium]
MADALLTPEVGGVLYAATVTAVAASAVKLKKTETETSDVPLMAVSGAMVFAAQMINFTIPGTGSSGHITGGILLAALLGPYAGTLTIAAVLLIQCLFFADGGLLALGANIFNMGVIPCLFIYPLLFRPIMSRAPSLRRISIASVVSVVIADQFGAFSVVLSTTASGITELPFGAFALLMQPIYLAIGVVEGFVTAAILCFVYGARPEILTTAAYGPALAGNPAREGGEKRSVKRVIILLAICAVVCGTGISLLASTHPDGLEWSIQHLTGAIGLNNPGQTAALAQVQGKTAIMPDYAFKSGGG